MVARFPPYDDLEGKDGALQRACSLEQELRGVRNVTSNVAQQALEVWSDLWAQLDGHVVSGVAVLPNAQSRNAPACGWPEFLEKMWLLRHYLDYTRRFAKGA